MVKKNKFREKVLEKEAKAGNKAKEIRSDCLVSLKIVENGGVNITLESKVKVQYGKAIIAQAEEILKHFGIQNANLIIEDTGAIPFVIAARIEAAVKQLISTDKDYLTIFSKKNKYQTAKDKHRISRLYLPGNSPSLMLNAGIHKPNGLILDLEDSVAPTKKEEARFLVRNALRSLNFYGSERMVRINQIPDGLKDLDFIVPHNVNVILIPKCESVDQITQVNEKIVQICRNKNIENSIWLMPIIESALGVVNAFSIASAAKNIVALTIGLEDYTADIGAKRTREAKESFFARSQLVNAARAAGVQPIDSVFSDVADMEGLKQNVIESKAMGFDGMGCIHPRQIRILHEYFAPDRDEIENAKKIIRSFDIGKEKGLGVVSLGSKMIDPPIVKRAEHTIDLAISVGKLSKDWRLGK
jgi:citrate lyase subunit beta / citryl-CoA lyase